ncbi:MAG: hypothetical protein IPG92_09450 [Flavobacteriales bacterium]|nr:hypothetical protein [Flavobacteriales bacterium]
MKAREGLRNTDPSNATNETMVIGWCYQDWGNPDRAEPFLREALEAFQLEGNRNQAMTCVLNLGDLELSRGDTVEALRLYRSSVPYWKEITEIRMATLRSQLAKVLIAKGDLDSARVEVDALNALHAKTPLPLSNTDGECEVDYTNYLCQKAIGQSTLADGYLERALNEALRLSSMPLILKYRKELSERYHERGDATNAAIQARAYIRLNDSLQAESNSARSPCTKWRERESRGAGTAKGALRQQRIISFSITGGLLLLVALAFTVYRGKKRSDALLLNILPAEVANELKAKGHADAKHFDQVTILFTDFKGFTEASEKLSPQELVEELNTCFKAFDGIITARGIEKIKTIGDAYMCAGGLPVPASSTPAGVVQAALEMQAFMIARKKERDAAGMPFFEMRVGIHTGPVVAGIVGVKKFAYDIWGDTVNTASRMESSGEVGQVNISEATYVLVKDEPGLTFTPRGKVQAKGKGEMEMYFVERT